MAPLNRSVVAVAYDGLCLFEFGVATELFGLDRPEVNVDWYDFEVVSADPVPIRTLAGLEVTVGTDLSRIETAGTVVIPGWRDPGESPSPALVEALRSAHDRGARLLSICSGVFVLAATGLLEGRPATTHWRHTEQLRAAHPGIEVRPDVLYVDDGDILTSAGSAAGLDLGLHLIARDHGQGVANQVARRLVVPPHREGGQAQFAGAPPVPPVGDPLADTIGWAVANLHRRLTVADLASRAHMSPRTFARRFEAATGRSPFRWLTRQRVLRARELLETTDLGIDAVADRCGLGGAANLRRHFRREARTTPTDYRRSFGNRASAGVHP